MQILARRRSILCHNQFFSFQKLLDSDVSRYISMLGMSVTRNLYELRSDAEINCSGKPSDINPCLPLKAPCLFDIEQDPCEYNNLAEKMPEVTRDLLVLLSWYNSTAVAPLNTSPDPMSNPKYWNYTFTNWADYL